MVRTGLGKESYPAEHPEDVSDDDDDTDGTFFMIRWYSRFFNDGVLDLLRSIDFSIDGVSFENFDTV